MYGSQMPFYNSKQAERDLRNAKLERGVPGFSRTKTGTELCCQIRGCTAPARKNEGSALDALRMAPVGSAFHLSVLRWQPTL